MSVLKILRGWPLIAATAMLTGCSKMVLLHPSGDIAIQQRDLMVASTVLLSLIIVPVIYTLLRKGPPMTEIPIPAVSAT